MMSRMESLAVTIVALIITTRLFWLLCLPLSRLLSLVSPSLLESLPLLETSFNLLPPLWAQGLRLAVAQTTLPITADPDTHYPHMNAAYWCKAARAETCEVRHWATVNLGQMGESWTCTGGGRGCR